jgi:chromate transporter
MVVYIRRLAVDQKEWLDSETFDDGVALCQAIPGATAMQTAAYVGLKAGGLGGAIASFTGFGLPAFLLMMVLAGMYMNASALPAIISVFKGLQAVIVAIVANAAISFGNTTLRQGRHFLVAVAASVLFGLNVSPFMVILAAALVGCLFFRPALVNFDDSVPPAPGKTEGKKFLPFLMVALTGLFVLFACERTLFNLALLMGRIDLFAFGGGYASVPLMFHEVVDVRHWMEGATFMNGIVLGQVTPGPIVITATFIGYLLYGPAGGIAATLGIFLPSFFMVLGLTPYYDRLKKIPRFYSMQGGVLCSFVGLLLMVTIRFALNVHWNAYLLMLTLASFIALRLKVEIQWVVLGGVLLSLLYGS